MGNAQSREREPLCVHHSCDARALEAMQLCTARVILDSLALCVHSARDTTHWRPHTSARTRDKHILCRVIGCRKKGRDRLVRLCVKCCACAGSHSCLVPHSAVLAAVLVWWLLVSEALTSFIRSVASPSYGVPACMHTNARARRGFLGRHVRCRWPVSSSHVATPNPKSVKSHLSAPSTSKVASSSHAAALLAFTRRGA